MNENNKKKLIEFFRELPISIPEKFKNVHYKGARIPGVENQQDLTLGANCQVYAYELLKEFGKEIPPLRSSDLWEDTIYTEKITKDFMVFDIMLYHYKTEAFGAHVGLYMGEGKVLHLSKGNDVPMIEMHESMLTQEKYIHFIGAKRMI